MFEEISLMFTVSVYTGFGSTGGRLGDPSSFPEDECYDPACEPQHKLETDHRVVQKIAFISI